MLREMATRVIRDFPLESADSGDAGFETAPGVDSGTEGGASGYSGDSVLSTGGLVAIIVVVVVVTIIGVSTAALFFIAKKREWTMKETIRRSARKVKTALTPRRTEFPDYVKDSSSSNRRGRTRIADDVPPTPRLTPEDVEKALGNAKSKQSGRTWPRR